MQKEILTYEGLVELVDQLKKYTDEKGSLETYPTRYNFPVIGDAAKIYITEENEVYRWDPVSLSYYNIGFNPQNIKLIDGNI